MNTNQQPLPHSYLLSGILTALFLLSVATCTGAESQKKGKPDHARSLELTHQKLAKNRDSYLGRQISIIGYVGQCGPVSCTRKMCPPGACCNRCDSKLALFAVKSKSRNFCFGKKHAFAAGSGFIVANDESGTSLHCGGTNCGIACGGFKPDEKYLVTGRWVKVQNGTDSNGPVMVYRMENVTVFKAGK